MFPLSFLISSSYFLDACHAFYLPCHRSGVQWHLQTLTSDDGAGVHIVPPSEANRQLLQQVDAILQRSNVDSTAILNAIDEAHEVDISWARSSPLPFEKRVSERIEARNHVDYETITVNDKRLHGLSEVPIAIRTKESTPIMNQSEIDLLKYATEAYWKSKPSDESSSRFTYQRKGNSEAHLSDVVNFSKEMGNDMTQLIDDVLLQRVYPWIREAFLSKEESTNREELGLYVYDSLFIRYNATEANKKDDVQIPGEIKKLNIGAGQPLHRDLGYVSVNIMLNDPSEFQGGGTFFEQQLSSSSTCDRTQTLEPLVQPLKPIGPGHALAHYSSNRHAGASTLLGVRDILVIFLAAAETSQITSTQRAPSWERAARLKNTCRLYCHQCFGTSSNKHDEWMCRIQSLRLAIDAVPDDGEAWHYLGMTLAECTNHDSCSKAMNVPILELAIACLEEGTKHTNCDARLFNNIGLTYEKKLARSATANENDRVHIHRKIKNAYEKAVAINSICSRVGCDVTSDYERVCLNFAVYLSYQDDFHGAVEVLSRIIEHTNAESFVTSEGISPERRRVIDDACGLILFCKKQMLTFSN